MDTVSGTIVDTEPPFNLVTFTNFDLGTMASLGGYKIDFVQGPC